MITCSITTVQGVAYAQTFLLLIAKSHFHKKSDMKRQNVKKMKVV